MARIVDRNLPLEMSHPDAATITVEISLPLCPRCGAPEHTNPGPHCWLRLIISSFHRYEDASWEWSSNTSFTDVQMEELESILKPLEIRPTIADIQNAITIVPDKSQ